MAVIVKGYYLYNTGWPTGLWSTPAKVEGVVLKAAWQWGSNRSVVKGPFRVSGRTPLYVGLLSAWDSMDGEHIFPPPPILWEGSLTGESE